MSTKNNLTLSAHPSWSYIHCHVLRVMKKMKPLAVLCIKLLYLSLIQTILRYLIITNKQDNLDWWNKPLNIFFNLPQALVNHHVVLFFLLIRTWWMYTTSISTCLFLSSTLLMEIFTVSLHTLCITKHFFLIHPCPSQISSYCGHGKYISYRFCLSLSDKTII